MTNKKQCVILGGGLAGLSMGALVGGRDYEVHILEGSSWIGGKCRRLNFDCDSYIDSGPSIFTFPEIWERYLKQWKTMNSQEDSSKWSLELERYSGLGIYGFDDGIVDLSDKQQSLHKSWQDYVKKHEQSSQLLSKLTYIDPKSREAFKAGLKLFAAHGMKANYKSYVKTLQIPERLKEIISIHALNTGSIPSALPAFFASLASGLDKQGVWFPKGGVYELVRRLESMNDAVGNHIHCNSKVTSIEGRSVHTEKQTFYADLIINSLDFERFNQLSTIKRATLKTPLTASALALYARLSSTPKGLRKIEDEHVVLMPDHTESFFQSIRSGRAHKNPMSFVSFHPKNSKVYPQNRSPVMALITTMPANERSYDLENPYLANELKRLGNLVGESNIANYIDAYHILDPAYFSGFGAPGGAIYGRSLPMGKAGPFHPIPYRDKQMSHVWHVGASVHPGGGIPAILGGVMIAFQKLHKDGYVKKAS